MAQYAVLIYAQRAGADRPPTPPEELAEHDRHAEELERSGAMLAAVALKPSAMATSIRGDAITDGPFIEAKEVVAGFYILEAPDLDAALEIARRNPVLHQGGGVEVRPVEGSSIPSPVQAAARAG
jgi:hypothetical protein